MTAFRYDENETITGVRVGDKFYTPTEYIEYIEEQNRTIKNNFNRYAQHLPDCDMMKSIICSNKYEEEIIGCACGYDDVKKELDSES